MKNTDKTCNSCLTDKNESCLDACKNEFRDFSSIVGDSPTTFGAFENYYSRLHGTEPILLVRQSSDLETIQEFEEIKATIKGMEEIPTGIGKDDFSKIADKALKEIIKDLKREYEEDVKEAMRGWKIDVNYEKNKKKYIKQWIKKFNDDEWYHKANDKLRKFKMIPELVMDIEREPSLPPISGGDWCPSATMKKKILFQTQNGVFAQTVLRLRRYLDGAKSTWDDVKRRKPLGFKGKDIYNLDDYWNFMNNFDKNYHKLFDLFNDSLDLDRNDYYLWIPLPEEVPFFDTENGCSMLLEGARDQIKDDAKFTTRETDIKYHLDKKVYNKISNEWGLNDDEPVEKTFNKLQRAIAEEGLRAKRKSTGSIL